MRFFTAILLALALASTELQVNASPVPSQHLQSSTGSTSSAPATTTESSTFFQRPTSSSTSSLHGTETSSRASTTATPYNEETPASDDRNFDNSHYRFGGYKPRPEDDQFDGDEPGADDSEGGCDSNNGDAESDGDESTSPNDEGFECNDDEFSDSADDYGLYEAEDSEEGPQEK